MTQSVLADHVADYDCHLLLEATTDAEIAELDSQLPTDTYLCRYHDNHGQHFISAIRSHKSSDIFDALHDVGFTVKEIASGYGRILPRLYQGAK